MLWMTFEKYDAMYGECWLRNFYRFFFSWSTKGSSGCWFLGEGAGTSRRRSEMVRKKIGGFELV